MSERAKPVFRTSAGAVLTGTMATYDTQAEASRGIPEQWRAYRRAHPTLESSAAFYGASPCTGDGRIHYLTGVAQQSPEPGAGEERLALLAGEYATVRVEEAADLRDTWVWLLGTWLPASGRREKNAPEFERFTAISEAGMPVGPVEISIPLEPLTSE